MFRRALAVVATTAVIATTLISVPAASATITAADLPALLHVAPVDTSHRYDRTLFEHWVDADADRCNTRYEVLIEESTTRPAVGPDCALSGGTWVSPYDGFATTDITQIQIDHVVALAEAWRSGAWAWTDTQRRAFANDLDVPYALTAASNTSNQAKADKDPAQWLPTNSSYICEYVTSWALVKYRWSLSVDEQELAALEHTLSGTCGATEVQLPAAMIPADSEASPPGPAAGGTVAPFASGVTRLAGTSRYETAIAVSRKYSPGVPAVFVATGVNFPDALSAAAAAAFLGGPLLLTPPSTLAPAVRDEIKRLRPAKIYIAGDIGAVGHSVESALELIAPTKRLGGLSRYETGNSIVSSIFPSASHAFLATGRTFPDALAASGAAGAISAPVILVDGKRATLPAESQSLLAKLGVTSITIVGGPGAVSTGIEAQLDRRYTTDRMGGASRYETAATINNAYFPAGSASAAFLATGLNFPDALAGAALAGHLKSPVYISSTGCVPGAVHLSLHRLGAAAMVALGDTGVVSAYAAANLGCLTTAVPTISGSTVVNSALRAYPGNWTAGTAFRYQWLANGASISGATASTLTLTPALGGKKVSVRITGTQSGYLAASTTSRPTAAVTTPTRTPSIDGWKCPSWAPIKGNASSMIYHMPGGAFYDRTNPEECFSSESAARAAGYRKALR